MRSCLSQHSCPPTGSDDRNNLRTYHLDFREVDQNNQTIKEFSTYPSVIYSNDFTKIETNNPGTKHNLSYDVYLHRREY